MTREERAVEALLAAERRFASEGVSLLQARTEALLAFADAEAAAMRERAAGVADNCEINAVLTPGFIDGASSAGRQIATAIRNLPTTGEVGRG